LNKKINFIIVNKSKMRSVYQRNVFIDSEASSNRDDKLAVKVNFPPTNFNIRQGQMMRITLSQFTMRRNFYNIHQYNNVFYLYDPAGPTYTPIIIQPGTYITFTALMVALQAALVAVVAGSTANYDNVSRKITITLGGAAPAAAYLVSFQLKTQQPPAGVSGDFAFMDTHEILGCIPTRDGFGATPVNAFGTSTGVGPHVTPYVAALNSNECIYLRTSLQTNNYQSTGFERDTPLNSNEIIPTQILARIPLLVSSFEAGTQDAFITFDDPNNLFGVLMDIQQLSSVEFFLTDDKGRPIASVAPSQASAGLLNYKFTLRWEIVEHESPPASHAVGEPTAKPMKISQSFQ